MRSADELHYFMFINHSTKSSFLGFLVFWENIDKVVYIWHTMYYYILVYILCVLIVFIIEYWFVFWLGPNDIQNRYWHLNISFGLYKYMNQTWIIPLCAEKSCEKNCKSKTMLARLVLRRRCSAHFSQIY